MDLPQNVHLNPDQQLVEKMLEAMKKNGGFCPCRLQHTEENRCICVEFRNQIADPEFTGYCHCHLYYKDK